MMQFENLVQHKGGTRCYSKTSSMAFFLQMCALICCICLANVLAEPYGGSSVGIHIPGGSFAGINESRCPKVCSCNGLAVDCSHRGLTQVPRKISTEIERLWVYKKYIYYFKNFYHLNALIKSKFLLFENIPDISKIVNKTRKNEDENKVQTKLIIFFIMPSAVCINFKFWLGNTTVQ